jgi:hypothetical protein
MNSIYSITINEYLEIVEIAKELGRKPGESIEDIFVEYMMQKGQKPLCHSELSKDEFLKEHVSHGNSVLNIDINKEGKAKYMVCKPLDNHE